MDDLLSAALCEAGLEEFITRPGEQDSSVPTDLLARGPSPIADIERPGQPSCSDDKSSSSNTANTSQLPSPVRSLTDSALGSDASPIMHRLSSNRAPPNACKSVHLSQTIPRRLINNSTRVRRVIDMRDRRSDIGDEDVQIIDSPSTNRAAGPMGTNRPRVLLLRRPFPEILLRSRGSSTVMQRRGSGPRTFLVKRTDGSSGTRIIRAIQRPSSTTPTICMQRKNPPESSNRNMQQEFPRQYILPQSSGSSASVRGRSISRAATNFVLRRYPTNQLQIQHENQTKEQTESQVQVARRQYTTILQNTRPTDSGRMGSRVQIGREMFRSASARDLPQANVDPKRVPDINGLTDEGIKLLINAGSHSKASVMTDVDLLRLTKSNGHRMYSLDEAKKQNIGVIRDFKKQEIKTNRFDASYVSTDKDSLNEREIEEEEENLGYAETYADYCPAKLRSGLSHPDCVIETASLSSVAPPEVRYTMSVPEEIIDTGAISAVQLEAVVYACQAHQRFLPSGERVGYLVGDGAGVGKGRTIACILYENYLLGRKRSIWLSVSADLRYDAERDLRDIGAKNIKLHALNKFKYSKISGKENGEVKKGCIFATYSSLIGECRSAKTKYQTRLKQLIQWCGKDFDGVIIFDECHRAKNLVPSAGSKPTKTGQIVLELQKSLPSARIVYASATGATEPRNMAYMTRLGLWGMGQSFPEFNDFISAVERRGVGAMEVVAMDMKQRGLYLARQLSFRGVSFRVEEVPLEPEFIAVYDDSVKVWLECRRQFQVALKRHCASRAQNKQIWGQFWAAHQRFFKYLCIGAKVHACVKLAIQAVRANKCVVIGLQTTGESKTLEVLDDAGGELTDFVSTAKAVLSGLIEKHFPTESSNLMSDIYADFDKICNERPRPIKKRTRPELTGNRIRSPPEITNKRTKLDDEEKNSSAMNNEDNESEEFSDTDSEESDSSSNNDSSHDDQSSNGAISGDEDTWLKRLLNEAKSSDEESDHEKVSPPSDDDEFNPFDFDFTREDPWAAKQRIVSDSPEKPVKKKIKKEKVKVKKPRKIIESEAMRNTAVEFISSSKIVNGDETLDESSFVKAELLAAIERLGPRLPANTLDQLIDELGGVDCVAEMTGRKGRVVAREDGDIEYELRHAGGDVPLEFMNMDEKDKFMRGEKLIAIISEAASSGISLQSDRRAENRRRRVHITLELPWSADKAVQQFGRTHRSNQVSAPEYIFLISELAGEKRFASVVAKRLESLGALTHGDRRATESRDLSKFNLDNRYGRAALDVLMRTITGILDPPLIPPPKEYKPGNFFEDMRTYMEGVGLLFVEDGNYYIEREAATIPKFLNRLLGFPVHAQNALFQYFSDIVAELVAQAKHDGTYDMGIMDLGMGGDEARKMETRIFKGRLESGDFRVEIHKINVERGVSWDDAMAIWKDHHDDEDGFYWSRSAINCKKTAVLVYGIGKKRLDTGVRLYCVTKPNTGRSAKSEPIEDLQKRFKPATPDEVESIWKQQFEDASKMCQHTYSYGRCKNESRGNYCETGRRTRTYFVLSGAFLSVWPIVEEVLSGGLSTREVKKNQRMQIIRVRTSQEHKIVGLLVLPQFVRKLIAQFEERYGNCFIETKTLDELD